MNLRRIAIASLLFAAAAGLYRLDGRRMERREIARAAQTALLPKNADGIDALAITSRGEHFSLSRINGDWSVVAPIKTGADPDAVRTLLDALGNQTVPAAATDGIRDWAPYGLERPAIELTAEWGGVESTTIMFGTDSPVKGRVYARLAGRDDLLTVDTGLRDQLLAGLYALRDKRLLTIPAGDINGLSLTRDGVTTEVRREGKVWNLVKPIQAPADAGAVEAVLNELKLTKPAEFITTATMELSRFGLDAPRLAATATTGDGREQSTLLIGLRRMASPPTYFATRAGGGDVFTIPQSLLDKLRAEPHELRNKDIFTFAAAAGDGPTTMTLAFGRSRVALARGGDGEWRDAASPGTKLDQNFTHSILARASGLKVAEHLAAAVPSMQSGLDEPNLIIELESPEQKESLLLGRTIPGKKLVYASKDGSPDVFAMDDGEPSRFFLTRDDFEDKALFEFDPSKAEVIEIVEGEKQWTFERQKDYWLCRPGGGKDVFQVRSAGAERFVLAMGGLRWKRRLDPANDADAAEIQARGLAIPRRTIRLLDAQRAEIANLAEGGSAKSRIYIRRGGKDDFALDIQVYGAFIDALREMFAVN